MDKMIERQKAIVCMEYLVRQINDEDELMPWLMYGVADGDIDYGDLDFTSDTVKDYTDDDTFKRIMSSFLCRMVGAFESGGLYCGGIVSKSKEDYA